MHRRVSPEWKEHRDVRSLWEGRVFLQFWENVSFTQSLGETTSIVDSRRANSFQTILTEGLKISDKCILQIEGHGSVLLMALSAPS